ncbi:Os01g0599300 [Oryza sativa Japonica Group]|jgi:hypothetical protein|uniref:Os01g0599300 protein n=1 Tax=Oryza sativa subsp. japonica TaxID=39947 RepID=A0A0P0V4V1_ORYSJ|nr:Os01g0599300 [Oryza sativa Japonica Group]
MLEDEEDDSNKDNRKEGAMEVEKSVKPTSMPAMVDVSVHRGQLYANTRYGMVYAFPSCAGWAPPRRRSSPP